MRHLSLFLALLVLLTGCQMIPAALKAKVCDLDTDGIWRNDTAGYCGGDDCDDTDANIGQPTNWFRDVDGDTFGAGEATSACTQPDGYVDHNGDCDDTNATINPDAVEICNGYDDNCDGLIDDQNIPIWFADLDEDTYGDPATSLTQCDQPDGWVDNNLDCDDNDGLVNPGATEVCDDGIDQDCNGRIDDAEGSQAWYADTDGDGYGNEVAVLYSCTESVDGHVLNNTDCDDTTYDISPAAFEACGDGIDNDCDGEIDTDAEDVPWYRDADMDGWGDADSTTVDCAPPAGYVGNAADCNDSDTSINPYAEEVCNNGIDDNCDESPEPCVLPTGTQSVTTADTTISDVSSSDSAGWSITGAGDVNGDGIDDLAVGAPYDDDGGADAGAVYVFYGPLSSGAISVADADLKLTGEAAGDNAGYSLTGTGDVNGDGIDDLAVGAPYDDDGGADAGAVYVFYGPLSSGTISVADADLKLTGEVAGDNAGYSLTGTGDVNGDGVDDLAVSATGDDDSGSDAGAVYVLYGPLTTGEVSLSTASLKLTGEAAGDNAGYSLVGAGDVNGDGVDDLAIGAPNDDDGETDAGAVYILYGPLATGEVSLSTASLKLTGEAIGDATGRSIAGGGDLNGDGIDDLAVGVVGDEDGGNNAGAVYILYGPLTSGTVSLASADLKLTGEAAGDQAGTSLSSAGDVNDDGIDDLAIGARYEATAFYQAGAVYVLLGGGGLTTGTVSLVSADLKLTGAGSGHYLGHAVVLADVNNDGLKDIILGTVQQDTYILLGLGY